MGDILTTLNLGVVDIPYAYEQQALGKNGKVLKKKKLVTLAITTGEVATILEDRYAVMGAFFDLHQEEIKEWITEAYEGAFHRLHATGAGSNNPAGEALERIQDAFKVFLMTNEIVGANNPKKSAHSSYPIPTQAALDGVNHRMAHPYAKRAPRPSFIDTGLYETSMRAWIE